MISDYTSLITSQHRDKPKFMATLNAALQPLCALQDVFASMSASYDLDNALGAQLDAVGLWVGTSRAVATPIANVYFAWDTPGVGWDQGVWQGPFDPNEGIVALDDETFRLIIRAKIAANMWDGTVTGATAVLSLAFGGTGLVFDLQDGQNMTMVATISGAIPNALFRSLFTGGYLPLKPVGVLVNYDVTSVSGQPAFGFDVSDQYVAGWDVGAWAVAL